eukprot:TRINITY_DN788_c0_g1_i2.p1 TRINITY_DN788_c0_g1~~TRINITY_DN788_c0_g1_i2.p1  ORF type:complete len:454 (-),score=121.68 TRINITY_DN788_c0_g1_i2:10-1371(-)
MCIRDRKTNDLAMNKTYVELVTNEAKIMGHLDHPNLVKLYEFDDKGMLIKKSGKQVPVLYLVLDLVKGGELFDYIAVSGRFSDKVARHYFKQFLQALEYLHGKGYAHRDIKAENVLLDTNYDLKLADFGFSTPMTGKDGSGKLSTQKGTPGYMAPEILMMKPYSGEKVDVFAAGVMLFIMVAQHPPFRKAANADPLYKMFLQNNAAFWAKVESNKPSGTFTPHLKDLLNKLMAIDAAARPTVEAIKAHPWMSGPTLTPEELAVEFKSRRNKVELDWKAQAAEALAKKKILKDSSKKPAVSGYGAHPGTKSGIPSGATAVEASKRFLEEYKPSVVEQTVLFSVEDPNDILMNIKGFLEEEKCAYKESAKKYKLQSIFTKYEDKVEVNFRVEMAEPEICCIRMEKVSGSKMDFLEIYGALKDKLIFSEVILSQTCLLYTSPSPRDATLSRMPSSA